ncbi:unnamed protein product, partial [Medioppia subpectinata]
MDQLSTNEVIVCMNAMLRRCDTEMRQSMDRFCDDLCQLVLSYLSLEERFRYEEVSKQWQRVIYETQTNRTLRSISVTIDKCSKESMAVLMKCLSQMTQLVDLKIAGDSQPNFKPTDHLKQLSINCPKLKRLSYSI